MFDYWNLQNSTQNVPKRAIFHLEVEEISGEGAQTPKWSTSISTVLHYCSQWCSGKFLFGKCLLSHLLPSPPFPSSPLRGRPRSQTYFRAFLHCTTASSVTKFGITFYLMMFKGRGNFPPQNIANSVNHTYFEWRPTNRSSRAYLGNAIASPFPLSWYHLRERRSLPEIFKETAFPSATPANAVCKSSTQNAPKCAIIYLEVKNFWEGHSPLTREGKTPKWSNLQNIALTMHQNAPISTQSQKIFWRATYHQVW